jgi:anthranilate phosphoribosyltransferase
LNSFDISPEQFGLGTYELKEIIGGTPEENAEITKNILSGKEKGAKRDIVLMNAGLGIYVGRDDISMEDAVKLAAEMIDSGKAYKKMEEFVQATLG